MCTDGSQLKTKMNKKFDKKGFFLFFYFYFIFIFFKKFIFIFIFIYNFFCFLFIFINFVSFKKNKFRYSEFSLQVAKFRYATVSIFRYSSEIASYFAS